MAEDVVTGGVSNASVDLWQACRRGKTRSVKTLLAQHPDIVHAVDPMTGRNALHFACANGESDCVKALLQAGAKVDAVEKTGNTPLHMVVLSSGMTETRVAPPGYVKCARLLLDAGAPVNQANLQGRRPVETTVYCIGELSKILEAAGGGLANSDDEQEEAKDGAAAPVGGEAPAANGKRELPKPSGPPLRELVSLALPHPTVHTGLCSSLWEQCDAEPDTTARRCLSVLDEVLGDVCADNVGDLEYERLEATLGCRIPAYVAALHARQLVPYELHRRLAHYSTCAVAVIMIQEHPRYGTIKLHAPLAKELVALLSRVLEWVTDGEISVPNIAALHSLDTNVDI